MPLLHPDDLAAGPGYGYRTYFTLTKSCCMSAFDLRDASSCRYSASRMTSNGLSSANFAAHRCESHDCSCIQTGSESAGRSQCRVLFQACECWLLHGNSSGQHDVSPNLRQASAGGPRFPVVEYCAPRSRDDGSRLGVLCYFR